MTRERDIRNAYSIKDSRENIIATVFENEKDTTSTSLTLHGRGAPLYGLERNENLVHLLENFADTTAPPNPIDGQLWWNVGDQMYVYNEIGGSPNWQTVVQPFAGTGFNVVAGDGLTGGGFPIGSPLEVTISLGAGTGIRLITVETNAIGQLGTMLQAPAITGNSQRGLSISPDGINAMWVDAQFNVINGGTMSTPFDFSTLVQDTQRAEWNVNNFGMYVRPDGTTMVQLRPESIDYGTASVPWDASTLPAGTNTGSIGGAGNQFVGITMNAAGTQLYISRTNLVVQMHELGTPWDLSTLNLAITNSFDFSTIDGFAADLAFGGHCDFNLDGTKFFYATSRSIMEFDCSVPFDITTVSYAGVTLQTGLAISGLHYDRTNDDKIYTIASTDFKVYSTFTDPSPAAASGEGGKVNEYLMTSEDSLLTGSTQSGLAFKFDGTEMYLANKSDNVLYQYTLSTPWLISSATQTNSIAENLESRLGMFLKPDGTRLFQTVGAALSDEIIWWDLGTPWDLSTATFTATHALSAITTRGVTFKPDGTIMYFVDVSENITQYTLATPWDPSTKGVATSVLDIKDALNEDALEPNPSHIDIDGSGNRMYIVSGTKYIYEFWLETAWDSSTAQYTGRRNRSEDSILGLFFDKANADKFFTCHTSRLVKTYINQGGGGSGSPKIVATQDSEIIHDDLSGFVANEHIDHSSVTITAGAGLSGTGTIVSSVTLDVNTGGSPDPNGLRTSADSLHVKTGKRGVLRTAGDQTTWSSKKFTSQFRGVQTGTSAAVPTYGFRDSSSTYSSGVYRSGSNQLSFTTNNIQAFRIESNGVLRALNSSYESLVTIDDHIPNKKYVDDLASASSGFPTANTHVGSLFLSGLDGTKTYLVFGYAILPHKRDGITTDCILDAVILRRGSTISGVGTVCGSTPRQLLSFSGAGLPGGADAWDGESQSEASFVCFMNGDTELNMKFNTSGPGRTPADPGPPGFQRTSRYIIAVQLD